MIFLARRTLLLLALMFWQGGFMFYGSVVVPVGSEMLGSHREQGFITQSVTNYLNVAGAVCLALWAWEMSGNRRAPGGAKLRWGLWFLLVSALALQFWLHIGLDKHLDTDTFGIDDRPRFRLLHQWYLIVSTIQWAVAVALTTVTFRNWHEGSSISRSAT